MGGIVMRTWKKPEIVEIAVGLEIVEIAVGLEINSYACAE
jgi:coenzyme PQQ precursor peptide PqqA